ncbi:MAG TPA: tetratricopeptide repeat protein, partial [Bryobacteraceae bacterium]|nr:tetratricopeptide repeat protein [Bryobacteraceae bacterium]
ATAVPALTAGEWIRLSTPNFEVFTTAGEKKGRELVLQYEQLRSFFMQASQNKTAPGERVRIVAFSSEKEFRPYRINEIASAYYTGGQNRDYIVMQEISSLHHGTAIHEYTHLVMRHTRLKLPIWLNEGWAEVFSTLKPVGKKAMVGELLPGRLQALSRERWMDLARLTSVQHDSPEYNEKSRAGVFYSQSWALTHMLYLGAEYRPGFLKMVSLLNENKSAEEAFQGAFGRSLADVEKDLRTYFRRNSLYAAVFDIKLERSQEEPVVAPVPPFESGLLLADLQAAIGKYSDAEKAFEDLEAAKPNTAEVHRSLGYLKWQKNDLSSARAHFDRAFAAGATDPRMCFDFAALENNAGGANEKVIAALERAIELRPEYTEARLRLGEAKLRARDFKGSLALLQQIKKVDPEHAFPLFSALAYCHANLGDTQAARKNTQDALKWSKSPEQTANVEQLVRYLDAREQAARLDLASSRTTPNPAQDAGRPLMRRTDDNGGVAAPAVAPPTSGDTNPFVAAGETLQRVEGTATSLDCGGQRAVLLVKVGSTTMKFEVDDPERVRLRHQGKMTFDFNCGAQKPFRVGVDYVATKPARSGVDGTLRGLEF